MKHYKILDQRKIDTGLLPHISKIFYVVGGLVNLQKIKMAELIITDLNDWTHNIH